MRFPPGPAHALPKPSFWAGIPQRSADIIGTTCTPPSSNPEPEPSKPFVDISKLFAVRGPPYALTAQQLRRSASSRQPARDAPRVSAHDVEHLAAGGDRLCRHQHEGDDAGHSALVHPVVDGAALHQHVAGLEAHAGAVELHIDLA